MTSRRKRLLGLGAGAVGLALGAAACAPVPPTRTGIETRDLYNGFSYIALVVMAVVLGLIAWSVIRYRARDDDPRNIPPQIREHIPIEITYFAIPQLIVVGMFVASVFVLNNVNALGSAQPGVHDKPLIVNVTGFQWGWDFNFPEAGVTVEGQPHDYARIELPTHRPIQFVIRARDVIHSFYVPDLLLKRDAIPGVTNRLQIPGIDKPGVYRGQCAELCGLLHSQMIFYIKAVPDNQFRSWLAAQKQGGG